MYICAKVLKLIYQANTAHNLAKRKARPCVSLTENAFEGDLFDNLLVWQQYTVPLTF